MRAPPERSFPLRAGLPRASLLPIGILAALVSLSSAAFAAQVYQWKDAKGVTHYADSPPPGQKYQDRRVDGSGSDTLVATPADKPAEDPQCTTARKNLDVLAGKSSVMQDTDGDGKADKALPEEDRANQRGLAEAAVKAYCKPAVAAGR